MLMSDKVKVVLRYVSQQEFERSDYQLAGGVNGRGWYWALVDENGKTDDEFGPEPTKKMARFAATQDDFVVSENR